MNILQQLSSSTIFAIILSFIYEFLGILALLFILILLRSLTRYLNEKIKQLQHENEEHELTLFNRIVNDKKWGIMKNVNNIIIYTKQYYPWEVTELQSLIADGLRSLKCNSIVNEIPTPCTECKDCEYKHFCKTLRKIYRQINDIKVERGFKVTTFYGNTFLK